jgi:hypothetical protein
VTLLKKHNKPWWTYQLSALWKSVHESEKMFVEAINTQRAHAKERFKQCQKTFNREVQRAKRDHWYQQQKELIDLCSESQSGFWRKIGKVGIGDERKTGIPLEIVDENGNVCKDREQVKTKWMNAFKELFNPETNTNIDTAHAPNIPHVDAADIDELNMDISFQEITDALRRQKQAKQLALMSCQLRFLKIQYALTSCCIYLIHVLLRATFLISGVVVSYLLY